MKRSLLLRAATVAAGVAASTVILAGPASAHVSVNPNTASQGGYTKVTFRVPNEKDSGDTIKVEVNLPAATPIASVSLKPVPGWSAVSAKTKLTTPIKSDDGDITEAITKITWTAAAGSGIKPGQFQEFDVSLGPLPDVDQVVFKTLQTYSDGEVVRWIDEPAAGAEPEHPAPVLKLAAASKGAAGQPSASAAAPVAVATAQRAAGDGNGTGYGIAGILLGLAGLVAGLLAYRRAAQAR